MTEPRPQLISLSTAQRCLKDTKFLDQLPEFKSLVNKANAMANIKSGCSSCAKRRAARTIGTDFIRLVKSLSDARMIKFKAYLGVDKILINGMNTKTKRYESIVK